MKYHRNKYGVPLMDASYVVMERSWLGLPPATDEYWRHASVVYGMWTSCQRMYRKQCAAEGHVVVVEADVGPESGTEHFFCKRCGWDAEINYY